jgi:hypothetical protein
VSISLNNMFFYRKIKEELAKMDERN